MDETLLDGLIERGHILERMPSPEQARAIRKAAGVTQAELAAVIQIRYETLLAWEKGYRRPNGRIAIAYVTALERLAAGRAPLSTFDGEADGDGRAC